MRVLPSCKVPSLEADLAAPRRFAFGDSYSQNGYDPASGYKPQEQKRSTSAGGLSWPDYLAQLDEAPATLRDRVFDFGKGGATIGGDRELVGYPNVSFADEIDKFEAWFVKASTEGENARPTWDGESTLFTVWFGINDIEITWKRGEEFPPLLESTFDQLSTGMERLYALGARHFLMPLLPPYHRSPLLLRVFSAVPGANDTFYDNFVAWNDRMKRFVGDFAESKPEASVAMWDTWTEFDKILDAPGDFGFANSTNWCDSYSKYLWAVDLPEMSEIQNCGYSMDEYFWFDTSHPTTRVHSLIATAFASLLGSSLASPSDLSRREMRLPAHHLPASSFAHHGTSPGRFQRLVRTSRLARREREQFWKELRGTALGSVVAGARVGQ
ncbi:SGNH/GDSL hydrolase family protein [Rhodotorula paludigena]|uniref:SGNH/GDSL hydrolase family protein n=1 Tax=Rhodotorula paludigena TaxID=86838 RepID=UPI003178BC84